MRTTLTLDDDVLAEVDKMRRAEGIGLSEAVNRLLRQAVARPPRSAPYQHRTAPVGLKADVANIADVLELLDDASHDAG